MKKLFIFLTLFVLFTTSVEAVTYQPLAPIDGYVNGSVSINENTLPKYLNNMFKLGIALCTGLAVLMIIVGGIQYASSDAWSKKSEGKDRIFAALFGLVIALGSWVLLNTINPRLLSTELSLREVDIVGIKTEYNKVYSQWTDGDDIALEDPNNTSYQAALAKWNKMQSEIETLDKKYGPQVSSTTPNVGAANKKVIEQINKGDCSKGAHCYASAVMLGENAGVSFNSVYQSSNYKVDGNTNFRQFGTAREPLPGEMVDVITRPGNATPYHTVIVYSNNGNGNYTVWDWKNNTTNGLRNINMSLNTPDQKGNIGRIYVPQNK